MSIETCVALIFNVFLYRFRPAERLIVVAEQYGTSLQSLVQQKKTFGLDLLRHVARCVFEALAHLHSRGVVHRNLHLKNVLVTPDGCVKLSCYGMYFMTKCGTLVSFPIGWVSFSTKLNWEQCSMISFRTTFWEVSSESWFFIEMSAHPVIHFSFTSIQSNEFITRYHYERGRLKWIIFQYFSCQGL